MHFLFLFLDGVGLGSSDSSVNPFMKAEMPFLEELTNGYKFIGGTHLPVTSDRATLIALDANLSVTGLPQSATGQAVLLTGENIPSQLGYHYGPKPNAMIADFLKNGNLFHKLKDRSQVCNLLSAYPPRYFEAIQSGRRMYSAIPLAAKSAGIDLMGTEDIREGRALSADLTGHGWLSQPGFPDIPKLTNYQAGTRLANLGMKSNFSLFEYWLTDYVGHHQDMNQAVNLLESFDEALGGLLECWNDQEGLILITSDHGNLEDLSTRRHTSQPVPGLVIGNSKLRQEFTTGLYDLTGIANRILAFFDF